MTPPTHRPEPLANAAEYVPVAEAIADGLRQDILDWRLRPGERIRQEAVARRYRASRLPVRQALQRLEMEGLLTFTSHVGARVTTLTVADLEELYRMRERLEPLALAESTPLLSDDQLLDLARLERAMRELGGADRPRWIGLDRRFHLLAYAAAPLPRLRATITELWNAVQPYRPAYTALPDALEATLAEHRELLEAISRGEADLAAETLERQLRRTRIEVLRRPGLFEDQRMS